MTLLNKMKSAEFVAGEFLTWLLWRTEAQDGAWPAASSGDSGFELWPDDRLRIEATIDGLTKNLLSGGTPSRSPEARTALASGKIVIEARWKLIRDDQEWLFTLKAPELDLRGVKLPELLTQDDSERVRERVSLMEKLERSVEDLYHRFLDLRLSRRWERDELPGMARWIAEGSD